MSNRWLLVLSLLPLSLSVACRERVIHVQPGQAPALAAAPVQMPKQPALVMRVYDVPPNMGEQIRSVLHNLFRGVKQNVSAKASLSPGGQLVVIAPLGIHDGVTALLKRMAAGKRPAAPPTVELTYWLVAGQPAKTPGHDPSLAEIEPALNAIAKAQGPMRFTRLDRITLLGVTDRYVSTAGRFSQANQTVSVVNGKVLADLSIRIPKSNARLETRVKLKPGQLLVLGTVGVEAKDFAPNLGLKGPGVMLFYVVRASIKNV